MNNRRNKPEESPEIVNSQQHSFAVCSSNLIRSRILSVTPNKLAEMSLLGERLQQKTHKTSY